MTDFLDEKRQEIQSRMAELRPLIDEYQRLEAAASALEGVGGAAPTATPARRGPGRQQAAVASRAVPRAAVASPVVPRAAVADPVAHARQPLRRPPHRRQRRPPQPPPRLPHGAVARPGGARAPARAPHRRLPSCSEQPGVTIPELAARMGIKQNYLYRVLPGLEQEKKVAKQGSGWHPGSKRLARTAEQ